MPLAIFSQTPIANQLSSFFVPEPESKRFQTRQEGDRFYSLKDRICLMTLLQVVIGNAGAQVMNVMESDVAGKPLQDPWKFVE